MNYYLHGSGHRAIVTCDVGETRGQCLSSSLIFLLLKKRKGKPNEIKWLTYCDKEMNPG